MLAKLPELRNMRLVHFTLILLTAFLFTGGFQCGDCEVTFCEEELSIRFLSKADNSDLFLNGTYNPDSLQVFAQLSNTTSFGVPFYIRQTHPDADGRYIYLYLQDGIEDFIFQFNHQESDTLQVRSFLENTECCDEKVNFNYGVYHGDTVRVERDGYLKLKK